MKEPRRNWTREELIVAFNLYCKIPFSKINYHHPMIKELADLIGRTPSAVAWKLVNFASLDPKLQEKNISGAKNSSKQDRIIFNDFVTNWDKYIVESEAIYEKLKNLKKEQKDDSINFDERKLRNCTTKSVLKKERVNQDFFRRMVLASYENKCCITDIPITELLVASHIIPWADDEENRLNPQNGLCLNAIHDKAFDKGLITFDDDYRIVLSSKILKYDENDGVKQLLIFYDKARINLPTRFLPRQDFLDYHRKNIFQG